MKRLNIFSFILILIAFNCWINSAFAQNNTVSFPDANLRAAVKSALNLADADDILEDTLDDLERLTATNKGIVNLTGLDKATGLTDLDLGNNEIVNLSPLASLTSLENLDMADNQIVNVASLSGLTNLEDLDLDDNQIVVVSGFAGLSSLETLDLRGNSIENVTSLSALTDLNYLYLSGNDDLVGDYTDTRKRSNTRQLVKLKKAGTSVDITLPSPVNIPDDNLEDALQARLSLQTDDPIFREDMETLPSFNAINQGITSLTGLEKATNLTSLNLSNDSSVLDEDKFSSISPLSRLTKLETLNLSGNKISSISSLSGLTALTDLDLAENKISSVSSLSRLTSLESLDLSDNTISSLSTLAKLTALTTLSLADNRITDVLALQNLSGLTTLDLSGNDNLTQEKASVLYKLDQGGTTITLPTGITLPTNVVTFNNDALETAVRSALRISTGYPILETGEKGLDTLTRLTATSKKIDDITGLEDADALTNLDLGNNEIVTLTPLQSLTSLTSLDLANNLIENFSALTGLSSLETLDLGQNVIVNVPALSSLTSLVTLDLADNNITTLPTVLAPLTALKTLDLRDNSSSDQKNNEITDVTRLSNLRALKTLYLRGNEDLVDDLTDDQQLANARQLVKLRYGETRTTIDITLPRAVTFQDDDLVSELRTLLGLGAGDPIFPADMQRQTFTSFTASGSSISNLTGLETATNLTSLNLNDNEISSITPLAKLIALETLNLSDNNISSTSSFSRLTELTDLDLSNNRISSVSSLPTSLTRLDLANNTISSISTLSKLIALTSLDLSTNRIRDVLPLQNLSSLRTLNLEGNDNITNIVVLYRLRQNQPPTTITPPTGMTIPNTADLVAFSNPDLEAVVRSALRISRGHPVLKTGEKGMDTLTRLTATYKKIDDITGLEEADALTHLDLGNNEIETLDPLRDLTNLTHLDLADNLIETLTPLQSLTSLTNLDLDGNQIQNVSALSGLSSLQTLDLTYNDVGDVTPLSGLTTLRNLYLRYNENLTNIKQLLKLENTRIDITLPKSVNIPDANLAAALRTQLSLPVGDPIVPEDMQRLTRLTASNRSIADLTGLETAPGLTDLTLSNNDIDDLEPLEDLTSLTDLNLRNNAIVDLEPLEELTNLETLDLRSNEITDVSPVAELTSLTRVDLAGNSITNPGALYHLDQGGTTITGITIPTAVTIADASLEAAVKSALRVRTTDPILPDVMAKLKSLTATRKEITTLSGIETAGLLERLDVGQNDISDLNPLSSLTHLTTLDLADNDITSITDLSGLTNLQTLDLRNNDVTDTRLLSTMTHLRYLYVRGNENLDSLKELVKLKEAGTRVDITLPIPVNVPDANLKDALRTTLSLESDAPIFPEDIERLTIFNATGLDISTLTGLEKATNLTTLNLANNTISSISALSRLTHLESLDLSENTISSISSLSGLTALTGLNLANNRISSISSLSRLISLTDLDLADNTISSISTLSKFTALTTLDLANNRIRDVLPLQNLSSLRTLNLEGNDDITNIVVLYRLRQNQPPTNITPPTGMTIPNTADLVAFRNPALEAVVRSALRISRGYPVLKTGEKGMDTLTRLTATSKKIDDITGLEEADALTTLDLGNNEITDLGPLQGLNGLTTLDLADNLITDFGALTSLGNLEGLDLDGNAIVNLPNSLTGFSSLKILDLSYNEIQDVSPLTGATALETLDLRYNDVGDVTSLSTMTHLKRLYIRGNDNLTNIKQLVKLREARTSIDITLPTPVNIPDANLKEALQTALGLASNDPIFPEDMETLPSFNATNQSITSLTGLEKATNLTSLTLANNTISSISPLSRLTNLETLNLSENTISSIGSLSALTALTDLDLANNKISSISSLSRLISLTSLDLSDNTISSLSTLARLTALTDLNLSNNRITDVLALQNLSSLRTLDLSGNDGLTMEKAAVLYKLEQAGTNITLPGSITLPTPTDIVVFDNAALETAVRSALRIRTGYPILTSNITGLTSLTATYKQVDDLTGLEQATALTRLDLGNNEIEDLLPLRNLTSLTNLDLADNNIEDVSRLSNLTNLTNLDLDDNNIENVSGLSNLTNLTHLDLRGNDVGDVAPLRNLTSLRYIYLTGNENLENLEWLGAIENLRADISLPDVVRLPDTNLDAVVRTKLRTDGNTVSNDLPMSEELLESLTTLSASNRGIEDLTGCEYMTELTSLDLRNNQIEDVTPLSKLYDLETLQLSGNTILDTSPLYGLLSRSLTTYDITISRYPSWDVNQDGRVDKVDLYMVTLTITGSTPDINGDDTIDTDDEAAADVNKDGRRDINDLRLVLTHLDRPVNLGAPLLNAETGLLELSMLEQMNADGLKVQLEILRAGNDGSLNYQQTVVFLQAILIAIQPNQTLLLANYPNPFNPETWIPYQLAENSYVRITIYDTQGAIIRLLELGYRAEGYYTTRSKAAHWDGRNEVGESVASGIYFYQLETDNVSLLRKMVVLK